MPGVLHATHSHSAQAVELLLVVDVTNDAIEEAEHCLRVTLWLLREKFHARPVPTMMEFSPALPPATIPLNMLALEQLSLITRAFMEGSMAQKRSSKLVVVPTSRKYTNLQMARLQGWCGLGPGECGNIPPFWGKIKADRDKEETLAVLIKHFECLSSTLEEPLNIYFSNRLVEDISNLRFSPNRDPDYVFSHLGISILSNVAQVQFDKEEMETQVATVLTLSDI